ncbi:hypothetical protein [Streptomyces virginiae]|uniref:hypothetical protein n=1 Tax=Streptomyces virginiae TaxID=1961 RepID=UPI003430B273
MALAKTKETRGRGPALLVRPMDRTAAALPANRFGVGDLSLMAMAFRGGGGKAVEVEPDGPRLGCGRLGLPVSGDTGAAGMELEGGDERRHGTVS